MSKVLAIDPGNEQSAYVVFDEGAPVAFGMEPNERVLKIVTDPVNQIGSNGAMVDHLVIEMIASYGMPVGREVFETCLWIGRFHQAWNPRPYSLLYRRDVKLHLCGQARAKDGNVRQALIDRWGGKAKAMGNKASPGPLYGFKADLWQALAVAVTYSDRRLQSNVLGQSGVKQSVAGGAQ